MACDRTRTPQNSRPARTSRNTAENSQHDGQVMTKEFVEACAHHLKSQDYKRKLIHNRSVTAVAAIANQSA